MENQNTHLESKIWWTPQIRWQAENKSSTCRVSINGNILGSLNYFKIEKWEFSHIEKTTEEATNGEDWVNIEVAIVEDMRGTSSCANFKLGYKLQGSQKWNS